MILKNIKLKASLGIALLVTGGFCCKPEKEEETPKPEFDRKAMLENIGNNVIVPNYLSFKAKTFSLDSAVADFNSASDLTKLNNLQNLFKETYLLWQNISTFEFGPAYDILFRVNSNNFPTDTVQINSNITTGSYDPATAGNLDAKGFPAIDFLLFGRTDNNSILANFTSDANAANRKTYLQNLSSELKSNASAVYNSWVGGYAGTFSNNTGTDVGSSLGMLVNELNYDYEILKNYRIGIPLGKKTLGTPQPNKVEAYYEKNSVQLAVEHIKSIENIYLGRSKSGSDGLGLDDYLIRLEAQYNSGLLSDAIKSQFSVTISKLQAIPDPLSETIVNNPAVVDAAYNEIQKLLVLLKTDMPSALGVQITYQDNDGD